MGLITAGHGRRASTIALVIVAVLAGLAGGALASARSAQLTRAGYSALQVLGTARCDKIVQVDAESRLFGRGCLLDTSEARASSMLNGCPKRSTDRKRVLCVRDSVNGIAAAEHGDVDIDDGFSRLLGAGRCRSLLTTGRDQNLAVYRQATALVRAINHGDKKAEMRAVDGLQVALHAEAGAQKGKTVGRLLSLCRPAKRR
jgi:hypothetical protein